MFEEADEPFSFLAISLQHWRDRVSNDELKDRPRAQTLSTVGIDINELMFDCGSKGTVNFRTWDFGGQVRKVLTFWCLNVR